MEDSAGTPPQNGDVFQLMTDKSFSSSDIYIFNTITLGIENDEDRIVKEFELHQNYPNPFNGQTTISFTIKNNNPIRIEIFNTLGQRIFSKNMGRLNPGKHNFLWDTTNTQNSLISSGVYFYRIKIGKQLSRVNKMILLK